MVSKKMLAIDVNNDGRDELVLLNAHSEGAAIGVVDFTASGDQSKISYYVTESRRDALAFDLGDINNDGNLDLVLSLSDEEGNSFIAFYFQDTENHFVLDKVIDLDEPVDSIKVEDINNDELLDLLTYSTQDSKFAVRLNEGGFAFDNTQEYELPTNTVCYSNNISVGDIHSNGYKDIVIPITAELPKDSGFVIGSKIQQNLIIPHIAHEAQWETYLIFDNIGDGVGRAVATLYNAEGKSVQKEIYVYENESVSLFLPLWECGTVSIVQGNLSVKEVFKNIEENGKGLAEFYLSPERSNEIYYLFPHYASSLLTWSGLVVSNLTAHYNDIVMSAYDSNGNILANKMLLLPPYSRVSNIVDVFFPNVDRSLLARIKVQSTYPISGIIISGYNNEKLLFTKAISSAVNKDVKILTHIAKSSEGWQSKLIFDSVSNNDEYANIVFYGDSGEISTLSIFVPANSTKVVLLNDISDTINSGIVTTTSNLLFVREGFVNVDDNGGGIAEFMLSNSTSSKVVCTYPYYQKDEITWEGMALFNPTSTPASVLVMAKKDGKIAGSKYIDIGPFSHTQFLLKDFFTPLTEDETRDITSIIITANVKLSAINISGSGTRRLLFGSGLPR
jgi:hypothetical protein